MSHLLSRILLAMLMLPLAAMVYVIVFFTIVFSHGWNTDARYNVLAGAVTWAFIATYWFLLWRKLVQWQRRRIVRTLLAAGAAGVCALAMAFALQVVVGAGSEDFTSFVGSATAPLLWLVVTAFLWRETAAERAERLGATSDRAITCPNCGYNLTGLTATRCPECGAQYTLNELLASQPGKEMQEVESAA